MATLQERLAEAEDAYHALSIGRSVAEVRDANGESLRYTAANSGKLAAYIADLKRQIGDTPQSGPMWLVTG